jgi:signal peptide peptidase SppA
MSNTRVSTTAPWFLPGGHLVGVRQDLLDVLKAMDGRTPREIRAEGAKPKAAAPMPWGGDPEPEGDGKIAVVSLIGPVTQYEGICDWMFGGCSLEAFMADMDAAYWDPEVTGIVMLVDSPGGEVNGIADAADRIRAMAATKPIVAFVAADGCSAAYWLPSAATRIVASQTAFLGSIGVVMTYCDDSKADEMSGLRYIEFVSSVAPDKRPDLGTDAGKAQIQAVVDQYGEIFVNAVAGFRGVTPEKVKKDFGQGGVLMGATAVEAGLADQIGTLADAVRLAAELASGAGDSSTGATPTTTSAIVAPGATMAKTAQQLRAEHPEAAAEIATAAAAAERTRIQGILKYNTAAYRAVAADKIDAAIADGTTTAGELATHILDAQAKRTEKVAAERQADGEEVAVEDQEPPKAPETTGTTRRIDTQGIYAKLNGGAR